MCLLINPRNNIKINLCVVIFLDGFDVEAAVFERFNGLGGGYRAGNGGEIGNTVHQRRAPDGVGCLLGYLALCGVDDELDFVVFDVVNNIRTSFGSL